MDISYAFHLKDPGPDFVLEIPGNWAGPDNCWPEHKEQEEWLNRSGLRLRQSWDCQWTFEDERAVEEFLAVLIPFSQEGAG